MTLRIRTALLSALVAMMLIGSTAEGQDPMPKAEAAPAAEVVFDARVGASIAKGQLLLTLHPGVAESELAPVFERLGAKFQVVDRMATMNHFLLAVDHERLPELRQRLENHPYVAAASFNVLFHMKRVFNDPVFKKPVDKAEDADNWNLYRIKAPQAWDITTGGALVAVIDSGAVLDHEDLAGRTVNPFSFETGSAVMQAGVFRVRNGPGNITVEDVRNHGTHVAITIGGKADNAAGTAGIAPNSPIMPLQALSYRVNFPAENAGEIRGWGWNVTNAIARAIDGGAAVINMSLGGLNPDDLAQWRNGRTPQEKQAAGDKMRRDAAEQVRQLAPFLDRAAQAGAIVVVAAGNEGVPAEFGAYALSRRVISVAATTRDDRRAGFSNFGSYTTVSAPGEGIWSGWANPGTPYSFANGTSMACPHVAGVVALMKTLDPELKLADVADILVKTGRPLTTDQPIGPLIDAKAALDEVRRRQGLRAPRQNPPPPIVRPPQRNPTVPTLPRDGVDILSRPDPWNDPDVQRIIQVWFSLANPRGAGDGVWVFNLFGEAVNIRITVVVRQPIWHRFRYRWFWENSQTLESTNMGSLYEFLVGTLRLGKFDPAAPRVPENSRPRPADPRPREGGLPFRSDLGGTRWGGRNARGEAIEFEFGDGVVSVKRAAGALRYAVRLDTTVSPSTIDLLPEAGGNAVLGIAELVGLGEMLIRTDYNDKRPAKVSRGDPLTFVLQRVDIPTPTPGSNDDGAASPVLNRGSESLLVSYPIKTLPPGSQQPIWPLPDGFQVNTYALSRDGKRVWVLLHSAAAKDAPWQLWSMGVDGSDAKQAALTIDPKLYHTPTLLANEDGSIGWVFLMRPVPFQNHFYIQLQQVTPGGAGKVVLETADKKAFTGGWHPRATADGRSVLFISQEGVVRVTDGAAALVQRSAEVKHGDLSLGDRRFESLAISADGSHWAATGRFFFADGKYQVARTPSAVVIGSPQGLRLYVEDLKVGNFDHIDMSADGRTVMLERNYQLVLIRDGRAKAVLPDAFHAYGGVLSPDGASLYAAVNPGGTSLQGFAGFVEDLSTGRRRAAVTALLRPGLMRSGRSIQLGGDGSTVASFSRGVFEFGPFGLYVSRTGPAAADFPKVSSVRQRYDGSKLTITVEASAEGPFRVFAIPLWRGYVNPAFVLDLARNPLAGMSGLPDGHGLIPVPQRPGVLRTEVDLGDNQALLDDTYTIRIVVVNAGRNRATWFDVPVLR